MYKNGDFFSFFFLPEERLGMCAYWFLFFFFFSGDSFEPEIIEDWERAHLIGIKKL